MKSGTFFGELKWRNVYKVAVAYTIVGWLVVQIATQVFPFFEIPMWVLRLVVVLDLIGFPIALVIACAFEPTPEGIKRTENFKLARMALITCPDCGKSISSSAMSCPACGRPTSVAMSRQKAKWAYGTSIVGLLLSVVAANVPTLRFLVFPALVCGIMAIYQRRIVAGIFIIIVSVYSILLG